MNLTRYDTAAQTDREALIRIITGLREAGWTATHSHDGEEWHYLWAVPAEALADLLMSTDEATLVWEKGSEQGRTFFVFGNSPDEIMADSSTGEAFMTDLIQVEHAINLEGE